MHRALNRSAALSRLGCRTFTQRPPLRMFPLSASAPISSPARRTQQITAHLQPLSRTMSSKTLDFNRSNSQTEVLQHKHDGGRVFILNRPSALNALNLNMVESMAPQLQAWDRSDICNVIMLKSSSPRAFCAGGDVKRVVDLAKERNDQFAQFFEKEYQLNYLIASVETPVVALIDGITMGGGVGLSVHAPFRVATERTMFAMPETAIGLFPDVGGSYFLPRLDGSIGRYLGLTGDRLQGKSVFWAGIATHYVPSARLPALEARLCELESKDVTIVNQAIEEFSDEAANLRDPTEFSLFPYRQAIDRCFHHDTVEEIVAALEREVAKPSQTDIARAADVQAWAQKTLKTLQSVSPTSLKVTLELLKAGARKSLKECLQLEYKAVQNVAQSHDFIEGVTKTLVTRNKDSIQWKPATLTELSDVDVINAYFRGNGKELEFLTTAPWNSPSLPAAIGDYGRPQFTLPAEREVISLIGKSSLCMTVEEVLDYFQSKYSGKIGLDTKVEMVLATKCRVDGKSQTVSLRD
ncbi:3-hydroxyisobutyryl-CoA hydrolase [Dimargaris verticillata]|uniref:3-hydroxyisobutyryl-CoA hydrolase n=1 Tax=Dimargaris verticillata TaxID=2761393 RepID=A0A9W8B176_9FUNG|nr:3-hydroxyisobutyryl-CoA hydrolase [Dimargaris verticillata]